MRVCQRQRRHLCESSREWLLVPPFTRAFLKSPSSRGLCHSWATCNFCYVNMVIQLTVTRSRVRPFHCHVTTVGKLFTTTCLCHRDLHGTGTLFPIPSSSRCCHYHSRPGPAVVNPGPVPLPLLPLPLPSRSRSFHSRSRPGPAEASTREKRNWKFYSNGPYYAMMCDNSHGPRQLWLY